MLTTTWIITTVRARSVRGVMSPYPIVANVTTVKYRALVRLRCSLNECGLRADMLM